MIKPEEMTDIQKFCWLTLILVQNFKPENKIVDDLIHAQLKMSHHILGDIYTVFISNDLDKIMSYHKVAVEYGENILDLYEDIEPLNDTENVSKNMQNQIEIELLNLLKVLAGITGGREKDSDSPKHGL